MRFRAFRALRPPQSSIASRYSCPPYDVLTREQALKISHKNPGESFVNVVRPDIHFAPEESSDDKVYEKAKEELRSAEEKGLLVRESDACVYLYGLRDKGGAGRWQWGVVGLVGTEEVGRGDGRGVLVHELTREDKERDRTMLTRVARAHTGPVFLCCRDDGDGGEKVLELVERLVKENGEGKECVARFVDDKGVEHCVLRFIGSEKNGRMLVECVKELDRVYVADGHHRAASAVRVAKEMKGTDESGWFMTVLFPASQLNILPYNRVVKDLDGLSVDEFLGRVKEGVDGLAEMSKEPVEAPKNPGTIYMYIAGKWYKIDFGTQPSSLEKTATLDASLLQNHIFKPILGINDPRRNERIGFVGGIHGVASLKQKVDSGDAAVAFGLHAVDISDLMEVADAGKYMPPKSTWFEPKLRSGLFINTF